MHEDDFCKRLIQLRLEKGVSARDMSLSIGQSEAYINRIENRKMLPSLSVFFYICDYFGITPGEFFQIDPSPSKEIIDAIKKLQSLNPKKQKHILAVIHDL
ncbi:MAG: helix-turn-helix transcriptional regulator [Lachnospiraceae bacterium]|jgi:Predicted transcriptional regulators|nr:helix-turn-helix transcriptional regulator [Lachnospiraceae bacterium]MCI9388698.1 helix-turn-helix transcriptional regulator [Lachnospiraceae bacterium]MCI9471492.1 helix-turn-helix transcriptional regulator [Lachnospiraceae bacterium]